MDNLTIFTEFLLMDISSSRELQILQDLYCISVSVPKLIVNSLTSSKSISLQECAVQIFLYLFFASIELAFLVVMAYDLYFATCFPLRYKLTVTPHVCTHAAGGSWGTGVVYFAIHTGYMFRLPFTKSNVINQYFCDVPQGMRISSSEVQFTESVILAVSAGIVLACFTSLVLSYVNIFSTVLKICSGEASNKTLSTCTPQLIVLLLFVISGLIAVLDPIANEASLKNLLIAVFYVMVPPFNKPHYLQSAEPGY
ncbi:olfactory receptor 14I1-like [Erinaceus europaeus]|uniref:Olfactory receptor 14I1-like n=1 Tax=Erinaceus europaeus TaxID=9365 RepID=A0A1S3APK6_ERIEU|nr:olfactory receptor 14I1-like [Erinaceus europaeus]